MRALVLAALVPLSALAQNPVGFGFAFETDAENRPLVTAIAPGGAAETAGLRAGDWIVAVAGEPLTHDSDALAMLRAARETLPAEIRVERNGQRIDVRMGIASYDPEDLSRRTAAFLCLAGDCWNGTGLRVEPGGDWYEGAFREGRRHGAGTVTLADGRVHSGQFADGRANGPGVYRWPDNTYWTGTFANDAPEPPGVYTDETGTRRPGLPG